MSDEMSNAEVKQRLRQLEHRYGMTSKQMVEMVEQGTLRPTPFHVEWLVLLDRGDLIGAGNWLTRKLAQFISGREKFKRWAKGAGK